MLFEIAINETNHETLYKRYYQLSDFVSSSNVTHILLPRKVIYDSLLLPFTRP